MIYSSPEGGIDVPAQDLISFIFDKQVDYDNDTPLLIDAEDPHKYLSNETCKRMVRRLVAGFKAHGLQTGDAVLCQISNTYLYPLLYMGIVGAGGIWIGSNPANQVFEVNHFVELGRPKFIITEAKSLETVLAVCMDRQFPSKDVLTLDLETLSAYTTNSEKNECTSGTAASSESTTSFMTLLDHGEQDWRVINSEQEAKDSPAAYFPTSGTTGLPKLAMVSHWNMIAHHLMIHQDTPYKVRRVISLAFFHLFATIFTFIQPMRYGHVTYVMKRFHLEKWLQYHNVYQATEAYMAPPMLMAAIQSNFNVRDLLKTVRYAGVGGAPCDAVSINKMRSILTDATMTSIWGMTEVGVATMFRLGDHDETGSVGRLLRGMEGKLIDADGKEVDQDGEPGELYCRTQGILMGYRNMDFPGDEKEWFRTGDVCCFQGGKLYIVGRAKELIKVKGWQVAPAELEALLLQHPQIVDAAVCGTVAANGMDEVPRAYVIRQKKNRECDMLSADEVYQFSRTRLASYKALDGGICFVEEIPRTASGKIQRNKLARMDEYRRSVTTVLLSADTREEVRKRVADIKDTAMRDIDAGAPRADSAPRVLRRSTRLSLSTSPKSSEAEWISANLGPKSWRQTKAASPDTGSDKVLRRSKNCRVKKTRRQTKVKPMSMQTRAVTVM